MVDDASKAVFHVEASLSIEELNKRVDRGEKTIGTLSGIGNDGSKTTLTFSMDGLPEKIAVVAVQDGGLPVIPDGSSLVATGTIFVGGALVLSAATR